jgi:hypothetical protein
MPNKVNFKPLTDFFTDAIDPTEMARFIDNAIFNKTAYHVDRSEAMRENDVAEVFMLQQLRNTLLEVDNIKIFTRPSIVLD